MPENVVKETCGVDEETVRMGLDLHANAQHGEFPL